MNYDRICKYFAEHKKMKCFKNSFVILVVFLSSFLIALFHNEDFLTIYQLQKQNIKNEVYTISDMETSGYIINKDGVLTTNTQDPQFSINSINSYVNSIEINFREKIENDMPVQVFFRQDGMEFEEDNSVIILGKKGSDSLCIKIGKLVNALRIDIGNKVGLSYSVSNIEINPQINSEKISIWTCFKEKVLKSHMFWLRFELLVLLLSFLGMHLLIDVRKLYEFLYRYRWLIGGIVVIFLTCHKLHGDSMTMYDSYIQPGAGSEYVQPVFGKGRAIRTDEWANGTTRILSSRYLQNPTGKYNDILRGTKTINQTDVSIGTIGSRILNLAYYFLGVEYGFCFYWNALLVFNFLITFEFMMILAKKKKMIALLGTMFFSCSSFYLWWYFPLILTYGHASLVAFYYFFKTNNKRIKILCAIATPIAVSHYICILYPAWQVPYGYIILAFLVWIIHDNWKDVKKQGKRSCILIGIALLFCIFLVISHLISKQEYMEIISNTVYPGKREIYGGYSWGFVMNYLQTFLFPYKDIGNPSEAGQLLSLFPLPIILSVFYMMRSKKIDWCICSLLAVMVLLGGYTYTELPAVLAKVTLLSYSFPNRTANIVAMICVYLIIRVLANKEYYEWSGICAYSCAGIIGGVTIWLSIKNSQKYYPNYLTKTCAIIVGVILVAFIIYMLCKLSSAVSMVIYISVLCLFIITGISVRPLQKGFDAIDSKPLAREIVKINDSDSKKKWITVDVGIMWSSFCVANGASTINDVNTYPNLDLWRKLDENNQYEEIYNRFAYVVVSLEECDTYFELVQADCMKLHLSYKDMEKINVNYVVSASNMEIDNSYVTIKTIYEENGAYIGKVTYK